MSRRRLAMASGALVAALSLSGCGLHGLQSYHLPGGATFGQPSYIVTVYFSDVTSLQPQSSVRQYDVPVGDVESITLSGFRAKVKCRIKKSVSLPANAVATLQQTSLLGEKFIAIEPPTGEAPQGQLAVDGNAVIADGTSTQPDIEDVFGTLSLLLNGGGVEQLQTINTELSAALTGRESNVRDLLTQLNTLVGGLDSRKSSIVRALESLNRLSRTLVDQKATVATALTDIAPGLRVLADREPDLTHLLTGLSRLGVVAKRVIRETKANTVADLRALNPVLSKFAAAGSYLPHALEVILDYPFPRNVTRGIFGDYTGLLADVDLAASIKTLTGITLPIAGPRKGSQRTKAGRATTTPTTPTTGLLPGKLSGVLPGLTDGLPAPQPLRGGLLDLLLGGLR